METGYILIADVLGFSKIVVNSADPNGQVDAWLSLVAEAADYASLQRKPQLLSDTVFAAAPSSDEGLRQLARFGRYLLERGLKRSLLIRGAIAYGPFQWGELTFGKAVIDAHRMEMLQDWIGITCAADIPHSEALWGPEGLVCYPPPLKEGKIALHPVVVWDVPAAPELQKASIAEPLVMKAEVLEWPWLRRLRNTCHLKSHLDQLSPADKAAWRNFNGSVF